MKLGIRSKLFLIALGVIVVSLAIGYGYLSPVLSRALTQRISSELTIRLELVNRLAAAAELRADDVLRWTQLATELGRLAHARVTLLDERGEVLGNAQLRELIALARQSARPDIGEVGIEGIKPRRLLVRIAKLGSQEAGLLAVFVDVTELRRLESLRRDFVANVSHELRTPVTAMRSAAETIRGAAARDPEAATRFLEIIERNGERLQRMVEDLLDLSRIESQELRMKPTALALPELGVHVLELLQSRADQKRIRMQCEMAADLPWVWVDRRALEQVLINLLDNAIKYCPPGSRVTLHASRSDAATDSDMVRVSVIDTGPGIAAHHLPRLFERFYRVDAGRSRELGGTGLGLAIVKHLVEAMKGEVSVSSEPGKGAVFSFTVPEAAAHLSEARRDPVPARDARPQ